MPRQLRRPNGAPGRKSRSAPKQRRRPRQTSQSPRPPPSPDASHPPMPTSPAARPCGRRRRRSGGRTFRTRPRVAPPTLTRPRRPTMTLSRMPTRRLTGHAPRCRCCRPIDAKFGGQVEECAAAAAVAPITLTRPRRRPRRPTARQTWRPGSAHRPDRGCRRGTAPARFLASQSP